jgi:hypothetical protein
VALKEKMLTRLERDRLRTKVKILEEQVAAMQQPPKEEPTTKIRSATRAVRKQASFPSDDPSSNPYNNLQVFY